MKEGSRFVDSDMHVVEPWDLFEGYLDPAFKHRVTTSPKGGLRGLANFLIDSEPTNGELNTIQYNRVRDPLRFARSNTAVEFASERGFDAEAQVMAMETEGIDIAVLFPTLGLSFVEKSPAWTRTWPMRSRGRTTTGSTTSAGTARTSSRWPPCCPCRT